MMKFLSKVRKVHFLNILPRSMTVLFCLREGTDKESTSVKRSPWKKILREQVKIS